MADNTWNKWAVGAVNAGLVLLGAWAAGVKDMKALAGATLITFLVAWFAAARHNRQAVKANLNAEWKASLRRFRDQLIAFTAFLQTALNEPGQSALPPGLGWRDVAARARFPLLGNEPLVGWARRNAVWMREHERTALSVARWVESVDHNSIQFQITRSHLSDILTEWIAWNDDPTLRPLIADRVAKSREALVMLAYVEIAHADGIQIQSPPPAWRSLPECWPVLAGPQVALPGSDA